jgi:hypothetical protein
MPISQVIGLFAGLVGTTATLLGAWAYIRSHRPPKKELLHASLIITLIMVGILGCAVVISNATSIKINGHTTVPVPNFLAPASSTSGTTTPTSSSTPTISPTSGSKDAPTPPPSSTQPPASTPPPSSTQPPASTPPPSSTTPAP